MSAAEHSQARERPDAADALEPGETSEPRASREPSASGETSALGETSASRASPELSASGASSETSETSAASERAEHEGRAAPGRRGPRELRALDRRGLLRWAAGLAAGAVLAGREARARAPQEGRESARAAPAASGAWRVRKALKYEMIEEGASVAERFAIARECGFEGVELPSPSELDPDEVLAARDASGLAIPGVVDSKHWEWTFADPDPAVRAQGRGALETALRDCARYGGTSVLLVPAVVSERVAYDAAWSRSQEELRRVLPLADELGVKIAFENVWNNFLLSPLEAARYVDSFESDQVGWHLDVGNLVRFAWPEQWVKVLGPRILKLDVKEYSRAKMNAEGPWKGFAAEIGEGDCGWPRVVAALKEVGWSGWACAEVAGGKRERLSHIAARMTIVLPR